MSPGHIPKIVSLDKIDSTVTVTKKRPSNQKYFMDQQRARIQADLSGVLRGDVRCDDIYLQMYASDASIYQIQPLAIVRPINTADVVKTIHYANQHQYTVHPRGAGSSVIGASLGKGIILDFSVHMRRAIVLDSDRVKVQPGVVLANLNDQLAQKNKVFGPDPATRSVTTLGGVLSTNATGSHWVRYGSPRDKVLALQIVTAEGKILNVPSAKNEAFGSYINPDSRTLEQNLAKLLDRNADTVEQYRSPTLLDQAGYHLADIQINDRVDLTRLMVGSEGTLGIITEATLAVDERPKQRGVALYFFDRLEKAAEAIDEIAQSRPSACDLLDRRLLSIAVEIDPAYREIIPTDTEAMLLVEHDAATLDELVETMDVPIKRIVRRDKLAFDVQTTTDKRQRDFFWRLARRMVQILYRLKGNRRAVPFVEDIAVNRQQLPTFLKQVHDVLNKHQVTATIFSHALQGHVDIRPFLDLTNPQHLALMPTLSRDIYALVTQCGGTISGGYGDGLSRTWYLRTHYGPLYDVFRDVKRVFDPNFLLNPGKIINYPPSDLTDHLRPWETAPQLIEDEDQEAVNKKKSKNSSLPVLHPQLNWSVEQLAKTAQSCNGCARCRTQGALERMCPIFRLYPREEASPRAKANLMRAVLSGELSVDTLSSDQLKTVSDLCVNCHQCRVECPAGVDIPKLVVEAKAQYVAATGQKFSQWIISRLDVLYEFGGRFPWLLNLLTKNRISRWAIDRFLGISQGRKLPTFSKRSFLRWCHRKKSKPPAEIEGNRVVYFVDAFANWNDTEIGHALLHVMQHNGVEVFVPQRQKLSGMSLISDGLVHRARELARQNVEILADAVRQGYHIVTTEPSANLALTHEYLHLNDDVDTRLVAENCSDVCAYLWKLHESGELNTNFQPVDATVGYHLPCHTRAVHRDGPILKLLNLIPELQIQNVGNGCSGMAGTFGLKSVNYLRSLRAGIGLITDLRAPEIVVGVTSCSTCKMQMEHGTVKPTIHPIKLLAMAYGGMSELDDLFDRRSGEKVLS